MNNDMWRECDDPDELAAAVAAQMRVEKGGDLGTWDLTRFDTPDEFRSSLTAGYRFRVPRWWKLADEELAELVAAVLAGEDGYDTLPQHHERWTRKARAVLAAFPLAAPDGRDDVAHGIGLDGRCETCDGPSGKGDPARAYVHEAVDRYGMAGVLSLLREHPDHRDTPSDGEVERLTAERDALAARLAQVPEVPDGHELVVLPTRWADNTKHAGGHYGDAARAAIGRRPKPEPDTERVNALEAIADKRLFRITEGELTTVVQCAGVRREPDGTLAVHGRDFYKGFATPVAPDGTVEVLRDGAR